MSIGNRNMFSLRRLLAVALTTALILSSGIAAGVLANRWSEPETLRAAAESLAAVPETCGSWQMLSQTELEPDLVEMLSCAGYVNRSYRHVGTRDTVHVALVLGPPGPIAVHTPEICYTTQGYRLEQTPQLRTLELPGGQLAELTFASFVSERPGPDAAGKLLAYHAFSDGGAWQTPAYPRFAFGGRPYLMKLQLASRSGGEPTPGLSDPCRDFLEAFLPALAQAGVGR